MPRWVWLICFVIISVPACDGTAPSPRDVAAPPTADAPAVSETSVASLVGLWDDGLVGENTKLDLGADGSAHIVSLVVVPATWTFDSSTRRVTVTSRRQADDSTVEQHVTYVPAQDVLTGPFSGPGGREQTFRRASQDAIEWWAGVRARLEDEENAQRPDTGERPR